MTSRRVCRDATRLVALGAVVCAGLAGCNRSDALRAELEHHDARVTPSYSATRVALDESPVEGRGAPFAAAPTGQE